MIKGAEQFFFRSQIFREIHTHAAASGDLPAYFLNGCAAASRRALRFPPPHGRHMVKDLPWRQGSNSNLHQNVKECRDSETHGEDDKKRRGEERGATVTLVPLRSRLSWPKQSQSLHPHKTNGGKSQPGGFDPLKGL